MKNFTFNIAVAALLLTVFLPQKAMTENLSSQWIVNQYAKSRLFVGGYDRDRKILHLGWQVSLKDGWKTYWRTPGDAGLPPRWTWKKTKNVQAITVNWPKPERINIFDMDTYVYHHEVILPIDVKIKDSSEAFAIDLDLQYLICADVCIPQEGNYSLNISSLNSIKTSLFQKAQLDRYRDLVPSKISGDDIIVRSDQKQENILLIQLPDHFTPVENVIVEGSDGTLFGRAASTGKNRFNIHHNGKNSLNGKELTLTLLLKDGGANETKVTVSK